MSRQLDRQIEHRPRSLINVTAKQIQALLNFVGVTHCASQRLIHVGQQCPGANAARVPGPHQRVGQTFGARFVAHKSAVADLDVDHHRIQAGGPFLGNN